MKYIFVLLALSVFKISIAQHCPYDGSHLIAIKLVDAYASGWDINNKLRMLMS